MTRYLIAKFVAAIALTLLAGGAARANAPRDSLSALEQRRRELTKERAAVEKAIKDKDSEIKKAQKQLAPLRQAQAVSEHAERMKRMAQLQASISRKRQRLQQLSDRRDSLAQLAHRQAAQIEQWEATRNQLARRFVEKNAAMLNMPLIDVQAQQLNQLLEDCKQFEGETSVAQLREAVQALRTCKEWHETTTAALSGGCNSKRVKALLEQMGPDILDRLRPTPKGDTEHRMGELRNYQKGIVTLKRFVTAFNQKAELDEYEQWVIEDKCLQLTDGTPLGQEMNTYVAPNTYLSGLLTQYKQQRMQGRNTEAERTINNL